MGNIISVSKGKKVYIALYNGKSIGSISYTVTFSGASSLAVGTALALASIGLL